MLQSLCHCRGAAGTSLPYEQIYLIQDRLCTGAAYQTALCSCSCVCVCSLCFAVPLRALRLPFQGGVWLFDCLWFVLARNLSPLFYSPSSSLLQNYGPFILTQLLLKPGWAQWLMVLCQSSTIADTHSDWAGETLIRHTHTHTHAPSPEIILIYEGWQFY